MKKISELEKAQNGILVSTTARIFVRRFYHSQGNVTWSRARNNKINDLIAMDFINSTPKHRYLTKDKTGVIEVRASSIGPFVYHAVMRGNTYAIIVIKTDYKIPGKEEISKRRLQDLEWSKMSSYIYKKLIKIANKLDKIGAYKEASELDSIIKDAIEYPSDFNPPPIPDPEEWEMEDMYMDELERENDQEYNKRKVPSENPEDLMDEKILGDKMEKGYDPGVDLLLKMENVLKRIDDYNFVEYDDQEVYNYADDQEEE